MKLLKDKMALLGTDEDAIIRTIKKVLTEQGVVSFKVDARTGMVEFWRVPSAEEAEAEAADPFREVLQRVQMDEYDPEPGCTPHEHFFHMCEMLEDAGCVPAFILTGAPYVELRKWIPFPRRSSQLAGIPIRVAKDMSTDTFLLCGAKTKDADPIDVTFVVKMTIP